jgi:hypothetical protein
LDSEPKICVVSCSVLKHEIQKLKAEGKLDAELVFVSKNFHVDYNQLENNLRKVLEHTKQRFSREIVLVYGDLCLGMDSEMQRLADEYGAVKVDALNCIDCQLGGGGKSNLADPEHNLMFMGPGMIEFFVDMRRILAQQGIDAAAFSGMYSGIKGAVVLDTLGDAEGCRKALEKANLGLEILEVRSVGCENVQKVVSDAVNKAKTKKHTK